MEDRRPDFRPTSKSNKAFTPLRTTYVYTIQYIYYLLIHFSISTSILYIFLTSLPMWLFWTLESVWITSIKKFIGFLIYNIIIDIHKSNSCLIRRWLSEFPICVPFCIRCYNQFCSFFLLNFFICFWLVIWFIQLLFIGVECGFRNGLMIGGRPMRTENNWQTAAEHRQGHGTNILDKLKEGHVPFFFFLII